MANLDFIQPSPLVLAKAIPALPVLFGLTGLGVGIYGFSSPSQAVRLFGLREPTVEKASSTPSHAESFQKSVIYTSGIRNIGTGLATLGLVGFWQFSTICQDPLAALAAKKCLGICFLTGSIVGLGDAWIIGQFAREQNIPDEARDEAAKASASHGITAGFILATGLLLFL